MADWLLSLLGKALALVGKALEGAPVPLLVGLISGWALFELTERMRARRAHKELSQALVAELEHAEVVVSILVGKYARFYKHPEDVSFFADEVRWFKNIGRHRMVQHGVLSGSLPESADFDSLSDDQLVTLYSSSRETVGTKMIMPVVDRALSGQTLRFSISQIQSHSVVRWQYHLLNQTADSTREMLLLTFSVTDENNHATVVQNHESLTGTYAMRVTVLLRVIRSALKQLDTGR